MLSYPVRQPGVNSGESGEGRDGNDDDDDGAKIMSAHSATRHSMGWLARGQKSDGYIPIFLQLAGCSPSLALSFGPQPNSETRMKDKAKFLGQPSSSP